MVHFLLTESFCKNCLFRVTSLWCTFVNPFLVVHPTHIMVHARVHRAHRLKSAVLDFATLNAGWYWSHQQWSVNRYKTWFWKSCSRIKTDSFSSQRFFSSWPTTLALLCPLSKCSCVLYSFKFAWAKTVSQSMQWGFWKSSVFQMQVKPKRT